MYSVAYSSLQTTGRVPPPRHKQQNPLAGLSLGRNKCIFYVFEFWVGLVAPLLLAILLVTRHDQGSSWHQKGNATAIVCTYMYQFRAKAEVFAAIYARYNSLQHTTDPEGEEGGPPRTPRPPSPAKKKKCFLWTHTHVGRPATSLPTDPEQD